MAKIATRDVEIELEPLDRLEDKVKRLIAMVDRMTAEQTRAAEENQRLKNEIETLRARAASSEVPVSLSAGWKFSGLPSEQ